MQNKFSLHEEYTKKFKDFLSQMTFCLTVHPEIDSEAKISHILLKHVDSFEKEIENEIDILQDEEK